MLRRTTRLNSVGLINEDDLARMEGPGIHTRQGSVLPRLNCPVPSRVKLQGRDLSLPESQSQHLAVDERENGADLGN